MKKSVDASFTTAFERGRAVYNDRQTLRAALAAGIGGKTLGYVGQGKSNDASIQESYAIGDIGLMPMAPPPQQPTVRLTSVVLNSSDDTLTIEALAEYYGSPVMKRGFNFTNNQYDTTPVFSVIVSGVTPTFSAVLNTLLYTGQTLYFKAFVQTAAGVAFSDQFRQAIPIRVPTRPRNVVATQSFFTIHLNWTAPAFDGGAPILRYTIVTFYNGSQIGQQNVNPNVLSLTLQNLPLNGVLEFEVNAINAVGSSLVQRSNSVNIIFTPPTNLTAVRDQANINLSWVAPTGTAQFPIVNYTITAFRDTNVNVGTLITESTSAVYSGLPLNVALSFTVRANLGSGGGTTPSTPQTTPITLEFTAPRNPAAVVNYDANPSLIIIRAFWLAPLSSLDLPITSYSVTLKSGFTIGKTYTTTNRFIDIPYDLDPNVLFTYSVKANSSAGTSLESVQSNVLSVPFPEISALTDINIQYIGPGISVVKQWRFTANFTVLQGRSNSYFAFSQIGVRLEDPVNGDSYDAEAIVGNGFGSFSCDIPYYGYSRFRAFAFLRRQINGEIVQFNGPVTSLPTGPEFNA